ncbi:predicted protein [Postia placenta Mad-698-R]|nr:predicted protein [Postia placenta Mad-698-R]
MSESSMDEAQILQLYQYNLIENYIGIMAMLCDVMRSTLCGTYLAQAAFASIRVYAIDGRRWTKATIIVMLGLVPIALNIYGGAKTIVAYTAHYCIVESSVPISKINILLLVTRICVLVSNLLVVISTWQATRASRAVIALTSRGSLTAVLFRDGTVHFVLVVGLNAANIVVALLLEYSLDLSPPVELISTLALCRFFLNLRQFSSPDINDSNISSHASSFSSFASRIIGNLGEMLEDDPQASDDDDLEGELDRLNDAEDVDGAVDLDDSANAASSDGDKAQTQMATMAVLEQETYEGSAANHEFTEAPDEGFSQLVMLDTNL